MTRIMIVKIMTLECDFLFRYQVINNIKNSVKFLPSSNSDRFQSSKSYMLQSFHSINSHCLIHFQVPGSSLRISLISLPPKYNKSYKISKHQKL